MHKIAFIDRDGVINDDTGHYYVYNIKDFKITEGLIEAFKLLENSGFKIIIITNQGGISKGLYTKRNVENIHKYLCNILKTNNIATPELYYCPHHESVEQCLCKKPQGLLIKKAIARFNGDKTNSFMIGDKQSDLDAAKNAGIKGFKTETNKGILNIVKTIISNN